jgi:hypothetical protein
MESFINLQNKTLAEIYDYYSQKFLQDEILTKHRFYIEANNLGFGERPFHAMWKDIIQLMPEEFKFLEIGVYKGQVLSLIKLLADTCKKDVEFYGVTPLFGMGDKFSNYEQTDYKNLIINLFKHFDLDFDIDKNLIIGSSADLQIKNKIEQLRYFDLMYIDGSHDYDVVISDIELMKKVCKLGAIIVFDDSACFKDLPPDKFKGHLDVCNAIKNTIEFDTDFIEILCVGHNRVFKKVS